MFFLSRLVHGVLVLLITVLTKDCLAIAAPEHAQKYNAQTAEYYVDPSTIPRVGFAVGESYAGQMPIGNGTSLFFWYFPTVNPAGKNDTVIWLNGGPGCSSLSGLLEENGPISWKPGTNDPVPNPWSWHKLANTVWVEYPVGTGFSVGPITARNDTEAAQQFVEFWSRFSRVFDLQKDRIFLSGESYAGYHVPYIGAALLEKEAYDIQGALMYDATLPHADKLHLLGAALPAFARYWSAVLGLTSSGLAKIEQLSEKCGLDRYLNKYVSYPPPTRPWPAVDTTCPIDKEFQQDTLTANQCFNYYHIQDTCPQVSNILGYPGQPNKKGTTTWPNLPEVQKALHVKSKRYWSICQSPVFVGGSSSYNANEHESRVQTLIEKTNNVIVGSGMADVTVPTNVTALTLQHLIWNQAQGFQSGERRPVVLPSIPRTRLDPNAWSVAGEVGTFHTERGLTFATGYTAGHQFPQYAPSAAFRHLEVLLGRVKSLDGGEVYSVNISSSFEWPF